MKIDFDAVQRRLEALFTQAEEPGTFTRLWGLSKEHAHVKATALAELFKVMRADSEDPTLRLRLSAANDELVSNVEVIEGLAATREHLPFAYVTWLWRVTETLRGVAQELSGVRRAELRASQGKKPASPTPLLALPLPPLRTERLQGFAVRPLIELANRETNVLGRRRRLLEAARRALLESSAALQMLPREIEPTMLGVIEGIQEITQWQQAGIDADESVAHQLRRAVHDRDSQAVSALLAVVTRLRHGSALSSDVKQRIDMAAHTFAERAGLTSSLPTLAEAGARAFGAAAAQAVLDGSERARVGNEASPNTALELVQAANCVDASFELGRSVAPVRAVEEQRRMALVPFPTQTMVLRPARSVADLPNSLISDPRLIVHQLATRSLLARRYLAERQQRRSVQARCAEARYYLLDGSGSMGGRRGRMRDAILISELAMMIRHLEIGTASVRPIVYYRYFSKLAEPALKVETIADALASIEAVITRKSRGETDIQAALIDSFHQIDQERARDPNLQRAQIVLISDGIADVDLWAMWRARESLTGMPVRVSVIALGGESPELRELAATQRARGEHVFYHYLSDRAMYELMSRTRVARPPQRFPELGESAQRPPSPVVTEQPASAQASQGPLQIPITVELELWQELDQLVDELSVLHDPPDTDALEQAGLLEVAYEELGVSLAERGFEAERARAEALRRDARAIALRFDRWFPDLDGAPGADGVAPPAELLEVIEIVLVTVSELTDYLAGSPLGRRVDAIELLESLLLEAGVSPWAYGRALPHATERAREALRALRRSAG